MVSNKEKLPNIGDYYKDKNILLTGGTGFIGKVLIEKLLYSCGVAGIYCLVRNKKGSTAKERLDNICKEKLFDRLRDVSPDFESKVHAIHGDIMAENLGISETDRTYLEENIHIVVHSAATVKFDESLKLAIDMNMLGVKKLVKLCKKMQKLEVLVHISTAYANCEKDRIEEIVYPAQIEPQKVIDATEWMNDDIVNSIAMPLISPKPNTYTFTKQLAETLLLEEGGDLPMVIIRPSIVTAALQEPYEGWIDNYNGVSGLGLATGKGLLQSCRAEPHAVADLVPVDLVSNLIIASAWYTCVHKPRENGQVYHITSGDTNPVTWQQLVNYVVSFLHKEPMEMCFRRPKYNMLTPNKLLHSYWVFVSHMLPAYIADVISFITTRKPRMVKLYGKLHKAMTSLEYFTMREWSWSQNNTDQLKAAMTDEDSKVFNCEARSIDWSSYVQTYTNGIKKYILKEDPKNVENARAHVRRLRNIRYCFNVCSFAILWKILQHKSKLLARCRNLLLTFIYKLIEIFTWKTIKLQLSS